MADEPSQYTDAARTALADAVVTVTGWNAGVERGLVLDHFERHLSWAAVARRARAIYETVIARRRDSTPASNRAR